MFHRIWNDIRANPGVWIGVGLAALLLVVGYLAYKNNQTSLASQQAANTSNTASGQPLWSTASVGSDPTAQPSNSEILAELNSIAQYIQSQQTPNPPGVANPNPPRVVSGKVNPIGPFTPTPPPTITRSYPLPIQKTPPTTTVTRTVGVPVYP